MKQQVSQIVGDGIHESEKPVSAPRRIVAHVVRAFNQGVAESIKQPAGGMAYSAERGGDRLADPVGVERNPPSISHDDFLNHGHSPPPARIYSSLYIKCTENFPS